MSCLELQGKQISSLTKIRVSSIQIVSLKTVLPSLNKNS